ncbi:hypothetical protein LJC27_04315 [Christensenellaceae bacterium OttesenSCG-928-M15]|nr:hypothetical protein [Christensenellaceae bacterium OttesenSCG-928-M15]
MALRKCPKCELNYIRDEETYCNVCKRDMKGGVDEAEEHICAECGENKALSGQDFCAYCLTDKKRREKLEKLMEKPSLLEMDMEQLDEIEVVPLENDIPEEDLNDIQEEFGDGKEDDPSLDDFDGDDKDE